MDLPDPPGLKVLLESRGPPALKVSKATPELEAQPDLPVPLDFLDQKEIKVSKVIRAPSVYLGRAVRQDLRAQLVPMDREGKRERQDHKVRREISVQKVK